VAPHELQEIEKTIPSATAQLDEIQSQVAIPHRMNDIGPLTLQQDRRATRTAEAVLPYPTHRLLYT